MTRQITTVTVSRDFVLAKCGFFTDVQLWPRVERLNAKVWLTNFLETEREHAEHLLHAFHYFSEDVSDQLFKSAFQHLSVDLLTDGVPRPELQEAWNSFRRRAIVTHVTGETPNDTDSGYIFVRKARQLLSVQQSNILGPGEALARLRERNPPPVLFVDDFVGTGDQFIRTWNRLYRTAPRTITSFAREATRSDVQLYYFPLICASKGFIELRKSCVGLRLRPAHVLTKEYSAIGSRSLIWPPHLRRTSLAFLESASRRAGIPNAHIRGHGDLALSIAFSHSVPDATLPLFYFETDTWKPLIRRA